MSVDDKQKAMKYNYQVSSHRRRKFIKGVLIFVVILGLIAVLVVLAIRLDAFLLSKRNTPVKTTSEETTAYFAPETKIFNSEYFQFQTNKSWVESPSDSTKNKFVYRSQNKNLINAELYIYVNDLPKDLSATRVLPVKLTDKKTQLTPTSITDHCNKAIGGPKTDLQVVSYKGVTVNCDIDNTQYNVLVGLIGGTTELTLSRPDGSEAAYTIFYRNVTANPESSDLVSIIESFQTR